MCKQIVIVLLKRLLEKKHVLTHELLLIYFYHVLLRWTSQMPLCLYIRTMQNLSQQLGLPSSFHVSLSVGLVQTCPRFKPITLRCPTIGGQWAVGHGRGLVEGRTWQLNAMYDVRKAWFTGEAEISQHSRSPQRNVITSRGQLEPSWERGESLPLWRNSTKILNLSRVDSSSTIMIKNHKLSLDTDSDLQQLHVITAGTRSPDTVVTEL